MLKVSLLNDSDSYTIILYLSVAYVRYLISNTLYIWDVFNA